LDADLDANTGLKVIDDYGATLMGAEYTLQVISLDDNDRAGHALNLASTLTQVGGDKISSSPHDAWLKVTPPPEFGTLGTITITIPHSEIPLARDKVNVIFRTGSWMRFFGQPPMVTYYDLLPNSHAQELRLSNTLTPSNGACGAANGAPFTAAPTTNLCSAGTASAVSGSGPWSWSCAGLNGGTTASCSANLQTYTVTLPGAPTGVTTSAGNAQATVSFTPPASNGGSSITSYTVTSSLGEITATGAGSPITVTGLTNGTAYAFTVTATNALGTGPASAPSDSVTPATVPDDDVFPHSVSLDGGWKWSPWFGYYHDGNPSWTGSQGWVYHQQHGWLYVLVNPGNGMFLWGESPGWWWTSSTLYPYVYSFDHQCWFWYNLETENPRWFYNYQMARWEGV
jgi:hypothetical protein